MSKNKLIVNVYALDATTTTPDHVTRQGFGVSTRLDKPIKSTTYHWQMRPNLTISVHRMQEAPSRL